MENFGCRLNRKVKSQGGIRQMLSRLCGCSPIVIFPLLWYTAIATADLPTHSPVPGGIAVLPLGIESLEKPAARFGSRQLLVVPHPDGWAAIVGLPLDILPGNYIISTVDDESETGKVDMRINALPPKPQDGAQEENGDMESIFDQVGSPGTVPKELNDAELINAAMRTDPDGDADQGTARVPDFRFAPITESEILVPFGKLVINNNVVKHDYLGYFSSPRAQVYAPAPGVIYRIVQSEDGRYVVHLGHGGNVISLIGNLSRILVQEGQELDRGEQIGTAGDANDRSFARVDWAVSINGYLVNPLQFTASP